MEQVERVTGIDGFGIYISKLFTIDAVFLNEDRHTHNVSVLMDGRGNYRLCPVYDNGAALLSDTTVDYPLDGDVYEEIAFVKSKTICSSFDEQLDIAEKLYGCHIKFAFSKADVEELLEKASIYSPEIRNRVRDILFEQMRKYGAYFGG